MLNIVALVLFAALGDPQVAELHSLPGQEPQGVIFNPEPKGSVLLIIGDDIGYADFMPLLDAGLLPNISSIAEHGTTYRRAYANGWCAPTRESLLLGQYVNEDTGFVCTDVGGNPIPSTALTLPEIEMQSSRALIGKHHMGRNPIGPWQMVFQTQGFQSWRAGSPMNVNNCQGTDYSNWSRIEDGIDQGISHAYEPVAVRDAAMAWWTSQPTVQPRVLWLSHNLAHLPFHAPPAALLPQGYSVGSTDRSKYEAMIVALDSCLADILSTVDWSKDLVIFIGDNGTPSQVAPDPNKAKTTVFERGIHVPLMISGPGFSVSESTALVHAADIFWTVAKHFGRNNQIPHGDGMKLQNGSAGHSKIICSGLNDVCAFNGTMKLRLTGNVESLFDLSVDPTESADVLGVPAYASIESDLRSFLYDFLAR